MERRKGCNILFVTSKKLGRRKAKENRQFQLLWNVNLITIVLLSGGGAANENSNDKAGDEGVASGEE